MSDEEWLDDLLTRVGKCLDDGNALAKLKLFHAARESRPHMSMVIYTMEYMCGRVETANAAKKAVAEALEKAKATTNVNIEVEGDLKAESGATVGIDRGTGKTFKAAQ